MNTTTSNHVILRQKHAPSGTLSQYIIGKVETENEKEVTLSEVVKLVEMIINTNAGPSIVMQYISDNTLTTRKWTYFRDTFDSMALLESESKDFGGYEKALNALKLNNANIINPNDNKIINQ